MPSSSASPGIGAIIVGLIVTCAVISIVTGDFGHWLLVILGIIVGLMAVRSIGG